LSCDGLPDVTAELSLLAMLRSGIPFGAQAGIVDSDGTFTSLADLILRGERIARGLRRSGFKDGDKVLFAIRPSATAIATMLGVTEAGGALVVADLGVGETVFVKRMEMIAPRWIIAESALLAASKSRGARKFLRGRGRSLLPLERVQGARIIRAGFWLPAFIAPTSIEDVERAGEAAGDAETRSLQDSETPVLMVFTSGTTAEPKAVVHTRRSMAATLDMISGSIGVSAGDVMYAREIHLILPALMSGVRAVMPPFGKFSAQRMMRDIETNQVTHFFCVTSECQILLDHTRSSRATTPASLRCAFIGAAPAHPAFLMRLKEFLPTGATALSLYGMTEILPVAAISIDDKIAVGGDGDIVGTPVEGVEARISDDGELVVRGPNLFAGYYGGPRVEEHYTGDLALIRDGRIVLLGRKKDMMIRGRHNIYPELHEPVIETIGGVRRCAMVGVYDAEREDEIVVLAVEIEPGFDPLEMRKRVMRELRHGSARIDDEAQPDEILMMKLPEKGRSGKVDKAAIRESARELLLR
jgi:acyl-CoA synthetase (AMP-forming)/AMP-acid ligase II